MNYRHLFHAGNFADVFKHLLIINIAEILSQKEKPWCYLDTHAGRGIYHLQSEESQKNCEFQNGIAKIMLAKDAPRIIQKYQDWVMQTGYPNYYPGSPLLIQSAQCPTDTMVLIEKHPEEAAILKKLFKHNGQAAVHHSDGYQALKAFLPPKQRRGFILIDPAFETNQEWALIWQGIELGLKRFSNGIFAVWYPIKNNIVEKQTRDITVSLKKITQTFKIAALNVTLSIFPKSDPALIGAGMIILNPPWTLEKELKDWLPWVWETLSFEKAGGFSVEQYSSDLS